MGYSSEQLADADIVLYIASTPGGGTYYVNGNHKCLGQLRPSDNGAGEYCALPAGTGTDHSHTGRCKFHGGNVSLNATKHARYANSTRGNLSLQYHKFANDPDILDLTPEVILLRSLLGRMVEMYEDAEPEELDANVLRLMLNIIESIGRNIERIEKIATNHALTVTSAKLIMLRALDVVGQYVPQERMQEFVGDWHKEVLEPISVTRYIETSLVK